MTTRHAGVMAPMFSIASRRGWGSGQFSDIPAFARWLASAGFDRLMLLPVGPLAGGDTSPYGAISAMAIDPVYITPEDVPEFVQGHRFQLLDRGLGPHPPEVHCRLALAGVEAGGAFERPRALVRPEVEQLG